MSLISIDLKNSDHQNFLSQFELPVHNLVFSDDSLRFYCQLTHVPEILNATDAKVVGGYARVAIVGSGIANDCGFVQNIFNLLQKESITVRSIFASELAVHIIVANSDADGCVKFLHKELVE